MLAEIICTRSHEQIKDIIIEYQRLYEKDLVHDIEKDTSGEFKDILVKLCTLPRDESNKVKIRKGNQDAEELYKVRIIIMYYQCT